MTIAKKVAERVFILTIVFLLLEKTRVIVQSWCVKGDSPMGAFEWIIWLLYPLELSENHIFSYGFRGGAQLNWFAWTRFVWFRCSTGVPLVLHWYSVGIMGCFAGVLGNVLLFRHCSGVFRFSDGVPCSGVPGFIVRPSKYIVFLNFFLYSHLST